MSVAYVVIAILGLALLMVVHEGGHYLAARRFGMRVTKFSIGFGPTIWKHRPKNSPTTFQVAIIPVLGPLISFAVWIWMIVVGVVAVREVLDYSNTGRALIVCLIAAVICWIVSFFVLVPLLIGGAIVSSI